MRTEVWVALLIVALVAGVIATRFARRHDAPDADGPASAGHFVFVKIPEALDPAARGARYGDPLDAALRRERAGEVTGGGTQLGAPGPDGRAAIEWIGLDVDLSDLEQGLPVLRRALRELGAPAASTLEYRRGTQHVVEPLGEG